MYIARNSSLIRIGTWGRGVWEIYPSSSAAKGVNGDGDFDLVVNCPDKPSNGVYVFENASGDTAKNKRPVFLPGRRISRGLQNVQVSYVNGAARVLAPGTAYPDFLKSGLADGQKLPLPENVQQGFVAQEAVEPR